MTGQLDEAADLVATVRIAVVDRESERYAALADRLADAAAALARLEDDLQHPPAGSTGDGLSPVKKVFAVALGHPHRHRRLRRHR